MHWPPGDILPSPDVAASGCAGYLALASHEAGGEIDEHAKGHAFYQEGLTGLRALAAGWVLLFHVNVVAVPRIISVHPFGVRIDLHPLLTVGWIGVTIFFVLSGFLLTTHLLDALSREGNRALPRYYVARVKRIVPAFWGQIAILFAIAYAVEGAAPYWTRYIPLHLVMLHNTSVEASSAINPVYWTLPIEFLFYVVLPLVAVRLVRWDPIRTAYRWKALVLIYAASVALSVAYRYAVFPVGGENPAWISNQLPGTIDQFMIGTVLATGWRWWRADHEPGPGVARLSTALATVGFMGIIAMIYYLDSIYDVFWSGKHPAVYVWYSVHAAFVGMLVLGVAMGGPLTRSVFANRAALLVGTISYSLYLWHFPVILWVEKIGKMGYATFFLVSIVACLAVSAISYLLLERPFLKMSRRSARAAS